MYRVSRKYVGNGPHEPQCRLFQETLPTFHQQLAQKKISQHTSYFHRLIKRVTM